MSRSSAAQEPSMDEILASIRRIIENGDETPNAADAAKARAERAPMVERLDAPSDGSSNVVARLTPGAQGEVEPATISDITGSIFSADDESDLAARLQLEIEAEGLIDDSFLLGSLAGLDATARLDDEALTAALLSVPTVEPVGEADRIAPAGDGAEVEGPAEEPAAEEATATIADSAQESAHVIASEPVPAAPFVAANSDSRRMQDYRSAVIDDHADPRLDATGAPIVSGLTGELVGASFDELAAAIREGELRSLGEMAEDLLRPMLQEWLDDNLPKMVERLVREEIERVARGGRR